MQTSSTQRVLYLLNMLNKKDYTKKEILEEFENIGQTLTKPAINNYIKKLSENNFKLRTTSLKFFSKMLMYKKYTPLFSQNFA